MQQSKRNAANTHRRRFCLGRRSLRSAYASARARSVPAEPRIDTILLPSPSTPLSQHHSTPTSTTRSHTQQLHAELDQTADACSASTRGAYAFLPGGGVRAINPGPGLTLAQTDSCFVVCKG